jgi:hypothetical protein
LSHIASTLPAGIGYDDRDYAALTVLGDFGSARELFERVLAISFPVNPLQVEAVHNLALNRPAL